MNIIGMASEQLIVFIEISNKALISVGQNIISFGVARYVNAYFTLRALQVSAQFLQMFCRNGIMETKKRFDCWIIADQ